MTDDELKRTALARICGLLLWRATWVCPHDQGLLLVAPCGACALCGLDGRTIELRMAEEIRQHRKFGPDEMSCAED